MLTRLRVRGFKNLLDVDVRFGPFTCIAGLNGVGKSNLFDAIRFLNLLTKHPIMEAVQLLRETKGRSPEPRSLFTAFEKYIAPELRFEAEIIVDRAVQDDFGVPAVASISTLKYEVAFRLNAEDGAERLELAYESLSPIKLAEARGGAGFEMSEAFQGSAIVGVRRGGPFISTPQPGIISVHQEKHGGRRVPAPKSSRTILGGTASSDFPTILAAHREMAAWQTLLLEPSAMRAPSFYQEPKVIDARGANLPAAIHRLQKLELVPGVTCAELANRLSQLVEDVQDLRVRDEAKIESLTLEVRGRDGIFHPARSLSDGTLRFLVLAAISLDPQTKGVICLEEPENGIHPDRLPTMVQLLKEIAVDPDYAVGDDNPLRQVMVNTHSPGVVREVGADALVYLDEEQVIREGARGRVASVYVHPDGWRARNDGAAGRIAPGRLRSYVGDAKPKNGQGLLDFAGKDYEPT